MRKNELMKNFINGDTTGKASNMVIEGDKLFNYNTVIAQRINGAIVINKTKYSRTTTTNQNFLIGSMPNAQTVEGVAMNSWDLKEYMPKDESYNDLVAKSTMHRFSTRRGA